MIPNVVRGNGFRGALDYIFDVKAQAQGASEKRPTLIASNMAGRSVGELAHEFAVVRSFNRAARNPVWHVSLAFAIGENPPAEQLARIPALFINKVGDQAAATEIPIRSDRNQWLAVTHHDKNHLHIHLLLNRINYDGQTCYCKWDKKRAQQACREIEQELGLVAVTGDSPRLFLDGRLIARLEAAAKRTGVVDPRLEQYRHERQTRLQEIDHERASEQPTPLRAGASSLPQRDSTGAAGAGDRRPGGEPATATTPTAALGAVEREVDQWFAEVLERAVQRIGAVVDRCLSSNPGANPGAGIREPAGQGPDGRASATGSDPGVRKSADQEPDRTTPETSPGARTDAIAPRHPQFSKPPVAEPDDRSPVPVSKSAKAEPEAITPQQPQSPKPPLAEPNDRPPVPASKPAEAEPEMIAPRQPQLPKPPITGPDDRSPVPASKPAKAEPETIAPQQPQLQPQVAQSVPTSNNQAQQEYQRLWQQMSQKVRKAYPAYSEQKIVVAVGLLAMSQWDQTKAIRILAQSPAAQARRAQGDAEFYAYLNKVMAEVSAKRKAAQHHKRSRQIDDGR